jgi:hypothetical protein
MTSLAGLAMLPHTDAVRRTLRGAYDTMMAADLMFLEAWEIHRPRDLGATLRAAQIRRANPALAAEIHAELARVQPGQSLPAARR